MKNTIVFIYNSFKDPLFQNLMFEYIKTVSAKTSAKFFLITFEQKAYRLRPSEKASIKKMLRNFHIYWFPLVYHSGSFILLKKVWDLMSASFLISWLKLRYHIKILFCFANIAASFGYLLSQVLGMKLMVYSYEPHSEFLVDLGLWDRNSLKFKLLNKLEWRVGVKADVIMTGTKWMVEELQKRNSNAMVYRAPTAVDNSKFYHSISERVEYRTRFKLEDKYVFVYMGKFGDLYYKEEIPYLCQKISSVIQNAYFLVLSPQDKAPIDQMFANYLPKDSYRITEAFDYSEVRHFLNASDMGICLVPPQPSQKFRSPTKIAEYLLCGLPYITMRGVSEDDLYAENENVGLVLESIEYIEEGDLSGLNFFVDEDKEVQVSRCVEVGSVYRSKETIDNILLEIYKTA